MTVLPDRGREIVLVATALFIVAYGTNVSTPFLVLYRDRLDLSDSQTMAIFTVYVLGILAALLAAGPISDRIGRRAVCVPFLLLSGVASLVLILGRDSFTLLLLGRLLLGVVSGAVLGVGAAWLQELHGSEGGQRAAVLTTVVTYAGFGAGPPVSALFERLTDAPLVTPFVLHAIAAFAFAPLLQRAHETVTPSVEPRPLRVELGIPERHRRRFWLVVFPAAIWVFGFPSTSFALFPVLVAESVDTADVVVAAAAGALTAWSALLSRPLLRRLGARRALPLGLGLGTAGYVLGAAAFGLETWPLVLPSAFLLGAASGVISASVLAILAGMADDATRGSLNSTFYLLAYPGMAMPIVLTTAATVISMGAALTVVTVLAAGATGLAVATASDRSRLRPVAAVPKEQT